MRPAKQKSNDEPKERLTFLLEFELLDDDDESPYIVAVATGINPDVEGSEPVAEIVVGSILRDAAAADPALYKRFCEVMRDTLPALLKSVGGTDISMRSVEIDLDKDSA